MFQTNLLEVDADMDVEKVLDFIEDFGCNTWLVNGGGILSFYPTKLEHQTRNPYLDRRPSGDLFGDAVEAGHRRGMRVHGADGFLQGQRGRGRPASRLAVRRPAGRPAGDAKARSASIRAARYYQEKLFEVVDEMIDRYPLDGFFFNMFRVRRIRLRQALSRRVAVGVVAGAASPSSAAASQLPTGPDSPDYDLWRAYAAKVTRDLGASIAEHIKRAAARRVPAALRRPRLLRGEQRDRPRALAPPRQRDGQRLPHAAAAAAGAVPLRGLHRHALPDRQRAARALRPAPDPGHVARREHLDLHHGRAGRDRVSLARASRARSCASTATTTKSIAAWCRRPMSASCVPTRWPRASLGSTKPNAEFRGLYLALQEEHLPFDVVPVEGIPDMATNGGLEALLRAGPRRCRPARRRRRSTALDGFVAERRAARAHRPFRLRRRRRGAAGRHAGEPHHRTDHRSARAEVGLRHRARAGAGSPLLRARSRRSSARTTGSRRSRTPRAGSSSCRRRPTGRPRSPTATRPTARPAITSTAAARVALVPWTVGRSYHELGLTTLARHRRRPRARAARRRRAA